MKLDNIFTSHMVIQARKPIKLYGTGAGTVSVSIAGTKKQQTFFEDEWLIELPAMEYSGPHLIEISLNGEVILLEDVYIGEVFLFAGQSNMQFKMGQGTSNLSNYSGHPMLRLFTPDLIVKADYFTPADGWVICQTEQIKDWPALAYLCGQELATRSNVAIGVVVAHQGGSVIESWLPKGTLDQIGVFLPDSEKDYFHYFGDCRIWNGDGNLYDYVISQIKPFPISKVIWYQGESNATPAAAKLYAKELVAFINIIRQDFCDDNLPFIVIQIPDYDEGGEGWPVLQHAQAEVVATTNATTLVVSADVSVSNDIHPPEKTKLAHRIVETILTT